MTPIDKIHALFHFRAMKPELARRERSWVEDRSRELPLRERWSEIRRFFCSTKPRPLWTLRLRRSDFAILFCPKTNSTFTNILSVLVEVDLLNSYRKSFGYLSIETSTRYHFFHSTIFVFTCWHLFAILQKMYASWRCEGWEFSSE